jgi:hypothetical protein
VETNVEIPSGNQTWQWEIPSKKVSIWENTLQMRIFQQNKTYLIATAYY